MRRVAPSLLRCAVSACLLPVALALCGCGGSSDGAASAGAGSNNEPTGKLVLTGSSTVAPLAAEIGKRFEAKHPGVRISVQAGGSGRGIADARSGVADIGMASRDLKGGERSLHSTTIARDGIGLIVHRENPVTALSRAQAVALYTDRVSNWSELGEPDAPVTVIHKAEGRATQEVFLAHFGLDNAEVEPDMIIGHNQQGIKAVAGNRHAVGYVSIGAAEAEIERGVPIKLVPVGGVEPTLASVAGGAYPVARPLNLITREKPRGLTRRFIEFARSEQMHELIGDHYFVPVSP